MYRIDVRMACDAINRIGYQHAATHRKALELFYRGKLPVDRLLAISEGQMQQTQRLVGLLEMRFPRRVIKRRAAVVL
jgi:hypothetical protein